jgi:hypothetical protein
VRTRPGRLHHLDPEWARTLARAALEAAAPVMAGDIAHRIMEYALAHEPEARTAGERMSRSGWRGHFHTAAHIALGKPLCGNCALPIKPLAGSPTGWTHDSGSPVEGWQGVRCPGMVCGAAPSKEKRTGMFKIGDRVRLAPDLPGFAHMEGRLGTVSLLYADGGLEVLTDGADFPTICGPEQVEAAPEAPEDR